jgi:hypothetical protein
MSGDATDVSGRRQAAPLGRQLPLPLAWRGDKADDAPFLIGAGNEQAARHILSDAAWPAPATLLVGPRHSGRSTLARVFAGRGLGEVVDTLEQADEEAVFHAWNRARDNHGKLLVIADSAAAVAAVRLPDLRTRLAAAPVLAIDAPDLCLTRDLVAHLLAERGLNPPPPLGAYVAARIERSYAAIHAAVAAIDTAALAAGRGASIATARAALIGAGLYAGAEPSSDSPEAL